MKTLFGLLALAMGIAIFGWIGYQMSLKGIGAITIAVAPAIAFASASCLCGVKWMYSQPTE